MIWAEQRTGGQRKLLRPTHQKETVMDTSGTHKKEEVIEYPPLNRAERRAQDRRRRLSTKREKRLKALKESRLAARAG